MKFCNCVALVNKHTHEVDGIGYCNLHKAAPELLAACKAALNMPAPIDRHVVEKFLKAAIQKAEAQL